MRMVMRLGVAVLLAALLPVMAQAGTTGKITGQVTDVSGQPIPGAHIAIRELMAGEAFAHAAADSEGFYAILWVAPGVYSLQTSMIGYLPQTREGAVVTSDLTTNASFRLAETTLELETIEVTAERGSRGWGMLGTTGRAPPVEPDRTTTTYVVTAGDIEAMTMVRETLDFVELLPGVTVDETGQELSVRGGDPEDVAYYVDGVALPMLDHIRAAPYLNLNRSAIQEMTVVTGGMGAEYGNAQGGVISIVTKDPGRSYTGSADYRFTPPGQKHWGANVYDSPVHRGGARWNDPDWVGETVRLPDGTDVQAHQRLDYTSEAGHLVEGVMSGPLTDAIGMTLSARWRREPSVFPGPAPTTPPNLNVTTKVSYAAGSSYRFSVTGWLDQARGYTDPNASPFASSTVDGGILDVRDGGRNLFLSEPNPSGEFVDRTYVVSGKYTHLLSNRLFYELVLSSSGARRDTSNVRLPAGITHLSEARSSTPITDQSGQYVIHRDVVSFERYRRNRLSLRGDLHAQIGKHHQAQLGAEATRFDSWYQGYESLGASRASVSWYGASYGDTDLFPGGRNRGVTPWQVGLYAKDKMEFGGITINLGTRFDAYLPGTRVTDTRLVGSPMYNSMSRATRMPELPSRTLTAWSTRVGVSHPLTDRAVLRFFYGDFAQFPSFAASYGNRWESELPADPDLNVNGAVDPAERWNGFQIPRLQHDPFLKPERTTAFEAGLDLNFLYDYVLGATVFHKNASQQLRDDGLSVAGWVDPERNQRVFPGGVTVFGDLLRDVQGIELNLRKRLSNFFAVSCGLNIQWANQTETGMAFYTHPDSLFVASGHYWYQHTVDPATGREIPVLPTGDNLEQIANLANLRLRGESGDPWSEGWVWSVNRSTFSEASPPIVEEMGLAGNYSPQDGKYWEEANTETGYTGTGQANLMTYVVPGGSEEFSRPMPGDRRAYGNATLLFVTPETFGPFGGQPLANLQASLVYRLFTGSPVAAETPDLGGPMHTRTDLSIRKTIPGPGTIRLGVEVYNLFNQRDNRSVHEDPGIRIDFDPQRYESWGIQYNEPGVADDSNGMHNDFTNFWDRPRELRSNLSVNW